MSRFVLIDHPLVQHKVAMLRDLSTGTKDFRELVNELSMLLAYEVTRDLPLKEVEVQTPICKTKAKMIEDEKIGVVPILRAGLGMSEGIMELMPMAKIGHIGLYRDPDTLQPVEYYCKLPSDSENRTMIVCDPMLATGGSAAEAIQFLKNRNVKSIRLVCIIGAPEGVARVQKEHPDVDIYLAALDEGLNDHGYIVPGLGDAGDRIFGTK